MKLDIFRKIVAVGNLSAVADECREMGRTVVLCHGCFDIVHPGHLRYLQFAKSQGDVLVVSLTGDDAIEKSDGLRPCIPQELRAENLAALEMVDRVVIADGPTAEPIITALRPHIYIKGKEYEHSTDPRFLAEKALVEQGHGRVIYSSGDVVFSSTNILQRLGRAMPGKGYGEAERLAACCARWQVTGASLRQLVDRFAGKRVVVVGDAICDHYVFCDAGDVAGEAPILSVRPLEEATYPGGAAIVAHHLAQLGASAHLVTSIADDEASRRLVDQLEDAGIESTALVLHRQMPTKQRFLVETQKLLKVDRAETRPIDSSAQRQVLATLAELRSWADAVVFVDFGYGVITRSLLAEAMDHLRPAVDLIAGDVSGTRQTLLAMNGADLLTPTERELRSVLGGFDESLPGAAKQLMKQLNCPNLAVTLGARGCVLFRPRHDEPAQWFEGRLRSEYLPALSSHAVDPVGAGDAFLPTATLALSCGAGLMTAGYLASAAAAVAVNQLGNRPVGKTELLGYLAYRPELSAQSHGAQQVGAG